MTDFRRPTDRELAIAFGLLKPWRMWTNPIFFGLGRIPADRPLLFVGNHTLYGFLDSSLMFEELYRRKGIFLRSLIERANFAVPGWRSALSYFGAVDRTPKNAARLLNSGECVLLFPGGSREALKARDEKYALLWTDRPGFARLAISHGCTIIPFSAVGGDDAFDILVDSKRIMASPLGSLVRALGLPEGALAPVVKGVGPTMVPHPQRFYFRFAKPISTKRYRGRAEDDRVCKRVRDKVRSDVKEGLDQLLEYREYDPERSLLTSIADRLRFS